MGVFLDGFLESLKLLFSFDKNLFEIVFLSFKVSLSAVIISSFIAIPIALYFSNHKFFLKKILLIITHTLMSMPPVVAGLIVYLFLSRNGILGSLELLYTPSAMIIAQMILAIPIIIGMTNK